MPVVRETLGAYNVAMAPRPDEVLDFCRRVLRDPARGSGVMERLGEGAARPRLPELLARLLPDVPDPRLALVHLERYERETLPPDDVETLAILLILFGFSPYLAASLANDRAYLPELVRARRQGGWGVEEYRDALARWLRIAPAREPWGALRTFKRRANLRIALRDLQGWATFPEVCHEISCAADALIQTALEIVQAEQEEKFGRPRAYDESGRVVEATMTVMSLGKLGGIELNYSSDIDLLFIYSSDGETSGASGCPESQITNKEFFTHVAEGLARGLGRISAEGQVFRVDCGLRPGGRDGDLATPLQAALVYYRTWARPWERQALIKARPCAGDLDLGARFLAEVEPVVYAAPPDPASVESLRAMKDRIDAELARRGEGASHVKLGRGGIREIEFTVQALQMRHGGGDPWVRGANTLLALHRLADKGYLSASEYGALSAAYVFLRTAEHRIQLHENLQRSVLPARSEALRALARSMGYRDSTHGQEAAAFLADLQAHREAVRGIYDAVLGRLSQVRLEESPRPDPFLDRMPDVQIVACLEAGGVRDAAALLGSVKSIARLLASPSIPPEVRRRFRRITPALLEELPRVHSPLRALRNVERFLASLSLEPSQLGRFLSQRELIPPLVRLFAGSQLLSSTLIHRPGLVLAERFGPAVARERSVADHVRRIGAAAPARQDPEAFAAFLRVYQRTQLLYVGLKDLNRQAGVSAMGRALSDLAEAILRTALAACARRAGWPLRGTGPGAETPGFLVLGLGKLGYRELDYCSDLDLVFLYEARGEPTAERHAAANRLAGLVMEMLTAITREGSLYAVDTRLRPFGGEGELAQPVGRLEEYFRSEAGVWEMQSYLKARPVAGDSQLGRRLARDLEALVLARAGCQDLGPAVREMKRRLEREAGARKAGGPDIKLGTGGLNAIQFAIQFLQLRHGVASPPHKRTTRLLATLREAGLLDEAAYRVFFTGFRFLRRLEHRMRLLHGRAVSRLPASREALHEIAVALGYGQRGDRPPGRQLLGDLARHRRRIEATFRRVIERADPPETARA